MRNSLSLLAAATAFGALLLHGCAGQPSVDCSSLVHLDPASPDGKAIESSFVNSFLRQWPTEYMGFEQLWSIDQIDDFYLLQGLVTPDESDLILVERSSEGFDVLARLQFNVLKLSKDQIRAELKLQAPSAPAALLSCPDLSLFIAPDDS